MAILEEVFIMEKIILVSGLEYPEAMETAIWYAQKGNKVYGCYTDRTHDPIITRNVYAVGINLLDKLQLKKFITQIEQESFKIDILVLCAKRKAEDDGAIGTGHIYQELLNVLDYNINGTWAMVEAALPLLRKSELKRIAFLTSTCASINWTDSTGDFAYHMSLSALHMMEKLYFNQLRPEGFSFRCFCTDNMECGWLPGEYIEQDLYYDERESAKNIHCDENRLVMQDHHYREIPW